MPALSIMGSQMSVYKYEVVSRSCNPTNEKGHLGYIAHKEHMTIRAGRGHESHVEPRDKNEKKT